MSFNDLPRELQDTIRNHHRIGPPITETIRIGGMSPYETAGPWFQNVRIYPTINTPAFADGAPPDMPQYRTFANHWDVMLQRREAHAADYRRSVKERLAYSVMPLVALAGLSYQRATKDTTKETLKTQSKKADSLDSAALKDEL